MQGDSGSMQLLRRHTSSSSSSSSRSCGGAAAWTLSAVTVASLHKHLPSRKQRARGKLAGAGRPPHRTAVVMAAKQRGKDAEESAGKRQPLSAAWEEALITSRTTSTLLDGKLVDKQSADESMGPLHFQLVAGNSESAADIVLYVPGIDFTGVLAAAQFPGLAAAGFEVWRCFTDTQDTRTTLLELELRLQKWVEKQTAAGRRVILMSEGFGTTLCLSLALRMGKKLGGLVLANPDLAMPAETGNAGPDVSTAVASLLGNLRSTASVQSNDTQKAVIDGVAASFGARSLVASSLRGTLPARLRAWSRPGLEAVASELRLKAERTPLPPVLLVTPAKEEESDDGPAFPPLPQLGGNTTLDGLIASLRSRTGEAYFMQVEVEDAREPLASAAVEVGKMIRDSPIYKPKRKPDYVADYKPPSIEEIEESSEEVERAATFWSPVFISRSEEGRRVYGVENVPTPADVGGRPVLLVGNHQFFGAELGPLVREFILEKGVVVRGLAIPFAFDRFGENQETRGPGGLFLRFGAVPVSPRNIFRLLQRGEMALLYPGGVLEAIHKAGENYDLKWQEETDFVRVAARFNAVVVPFGGVGVDDNLALFGDGTEVFKAFRDATRNGDSDGGPGGSRSRGGGLMPTSNALSQRPEFPLLAGPRLNPATSSSAGFGDRLYLSFGEPVDLADVDPNDKEACAANYKAIRTAVRSEIDWLLEAREKDPYRDLLQRLVYEQTATLDPSYPRRKIKGGPWEGAEVQSYGARAPSGILEAK